VRDYGDRRGYYDFRNALLTAPDLQIGERARVGVRREQAFPNVPFDSLLARGLFGSSAVKEDGVEKTASKNLQQN
jgi:hypothetical protein